MTHPIYPTRTGEQLAVVLHPRGHAKVDAGPGSGKTATMIDRVHYLLSEGIDHRRILVTMFNKKAEEEFSSRLQNRLGHGATSPEVRTFHSMGARICKRLESAGLLHGARLITDEMEVFRLIRDAIRLAADSTTPPDIVNSPETIEAFTSYIEFVKADLGQPEEVFRRLMLPADYSFFIRGFSTFETLRRTKKVRTFSDLIYDPALIFANKPETRSLVADRLLHLIVDEYQDINQAQHFLIEVLAGKTAQVMAIGDCDQVLYRWRGAHPEFIMSEFDRRFAQPTTYKLTATFRYGHRLALAANSVIFCNDERLDKISVSTSRTPETKINVRPETELVATVLDWKKRGGKLKQIAVLSRLFSSMQACELQLLAHEIPYRLQGAESVVQSHITKTILACAHIANGTIGTALTRTELVRSFITTPPTGISRDEAAELLDDLTRTPERAVAILNNRAMTLTGFASRGLSSRARAWATLRDMGPDSTILDVITAYERSADVLAWFGKSPTAEKADEKLRLWTSIRDLSGNNQQKVGQFIDYVASLERTLEKLSNEEDSLLMTSIHRSKGLEFPCVIIPGLVDGTFPHMPPTQSPFNAAVHMQDERRLFFVAMTRAQSELNLLVPADQALLAAISSENRKAPTPCLASRFLYEANLGLADRVAQAIYRPQAELLADTPEPDLANRYFDALGLPLSIEVRPPPPPPPVVLSPFGAHPSLKPDQIIEIQGRVFRLDGMVTHPTLGQGVLTAIVQDGKYLEVRFHGERASRTMSAEGAVRLGLAPVSA